MRILNFGSVNIDHVYAVDHFVRPGETLPSAGYRRFAGGKGFNQSIALARAGAAVWHAGRIGADGAWLREQLAADGADVSYLRVGDAPTGHAIIQVAPTGENAIILHGGANRSVTADDAERVLAAFGPGDCLLLQNEISEAARILALGAARGLSVVLNTAPFTPELLTWPLERVSVFILNELEGAGLTGGTDPERIVAALCTRFASAGVVLTLGRAGVLFGQGPRRIRVPAEAVKAVDTTAAGDTFTGYFLAEHARGADTETALRIGCRAAALCVTRPGAADSIPRRSELG